MSPTEIRRVEARADDALSARVIRRVPILYAAGADPVADRPAHARAGSGLAWVGDRLAVVQDDANFIALVDPETGLAESVELPRGPDGARQFDDARGNKRDKLDLEALTTVPSPEGQRLIAFGSGSSPRRECIAVIRLAGGSAIGTHVRQESALYGMLRDAAHFAGSELNLEGAIYGGGWIRLFGRGNGVARGKLLPIDATCDLDCRRLLAHLERPASAPPPTPDNVVQYDLGTLRGVRLGFTDAAVRGDGDGALRNAIFTAAAEASPDAIRDGPVTGSVVGIIDEGATGIVARWTELRSADREGASGKVEGIALSRGDTAFVVVDRDVHHLPSELWEVELVGPWWPAR